MTTNASDISVIICTYTVHRWDDLAAAIRSLKHQSVAPREIIVVVDHNLALLARVRQHIDGVRAIENREAKGLSGARNSGVAAATGKFVAFLDDDATAAPDWLERLGHCCADPRVLGAGGAAEPVWQGRRPHWFPEEFLWVVGCSYRGLPETIASVRNLYGGCCCIRRDVLLAAGGFRSGLGRNGTRPTGCEETELCIRAFKQWPSCMFLFDPQARIYHKVPATRATWTYFRERCFAEGLSKAWVSQLVGARDALSSERAHVRRVLPKAVVKALGDLLTWTDPRGANRALAIIMGLFFAAAGYAAGRLRYVADWDDDATLQTSSAA